MNLKIISAGAGSGKTYRLTQEMVALLRGGLRASGIIATTFTNKAAAELQERVRVKLLEEGLSEAANDLTNALIGTVHSLGVKLLRRFAFEAGVSPEVDIIADEDQQLLFNRSLATILHPDRVVQMERWCDRLGLHQNDRYDWRQEVKFLTDTARANDFSLEVLEESKRRSVQSFAAFLEPRATKSPETFSRELRQQIETAIAALHANEDETKVTRIAGEDLQQFCERLRRGQELHWHEWVKISKIKVGAKSRDDVADLVQFARTHESHPQFHADIENFIHGIFDLAIEALREYDQYKKQRGLIDYIDMEIQVKRLLDQAAIRAILAEELDLLMVDEFQDTNPIQLDIFLKLSRIAKHSIWVGDPKQSIYGFRGADPRLMQAIIEQNGGIREADIQRHSWRSRENIVYATNALFCRAFPQLPTEQVALDPKRRALAGPHTANTENEPIGMDEALVHWHFEYDGEGRRLPGKPWMENCIADSIRRFVEMGKIVFSKAEKRYRPVRPGDIAVLCRSNAACTTIAEALHRRGLKAAISRTGLLQTAEIQLVLACLKFILNPKDALSVAEILLLADGQSIEAILDDRLAFLARVEGYAQEIRWAEQQAFIDQLHRLRPEVAELSSAELLNLVLEELDLRRIIASWGKVAQRLDNVAVLRKLALQYEAACNRLHSAASLGGFLLWLNELEAKDQDKQGSGEGADAVNVLTYHKSKGLEWPVVICHSLEGKLRDRVWGVDLVPESEEVDFDNLLGNRWLRYWVNPYASQLRNTPLEERLQASAAQQRATIQAREEDARLLYVGMTRARDYLIFPTRARPTLWLNRIWHEGQEEFPTLDPQNGETPWEWNEQVLYADTNVFPYPRDFTHADPPSAATSFWEAPRGKSTYLEYFIDVDQKMVRDAFRVRRSQRHTYGLPLVLAGEVPAYQAAKATKAFLAADRWRDPAEERLSMARAIVERFELVEGLETREVVRAGTVFREEMERQFRPQRYWRKYPVELLREEQLFRTVIDLIVETEAGLVLVQHTSFGGSGQKAQLQKAKDLRAWAHLSKVALQEIFQKRTVRTLIHFVLDGSWVELETEQVGVQVGLF